MAQLKRLGVDNCRIEGESNDWKLVDTQDVIVHIFHPKESFTIWKICGQKKFQRRRLLYEEILFLPFILLVLLSSIAYSKNELYEKIDLFVRYENIKKNTLMM